MARLKRVNLFPEYARIEEPNYEVLARCVELAKGEQSVREFAQLCGTSGATISRIINQQITAPIPDNLLINICKNAPVGSSVTQDIMLIANGMRPIKVGDGMSESKTAEVANDMSKKFRMKEAEFEMQAREILQNELLFKGYSIELVMNPIICQIKREFQYRADFAFKTNALEDLGVDTWCFEVMSEFAVHSIHKMHTLFSACYLGNPSENRTKMSLVVTNRTTYEQLKERYTGIVIRDYISIILIDISERRVVEEYNLETMEKK